MSTNNKENLIQIPESIENLMRDYYKKTEDEQKITDAIDKLKNFKIENQDDKSKINELRGSLENLFSFIKDFNLYQNNLELKTLKDGVDFVSYVLNLNKEYKIGVNTYTMVLVLNSLVSELDKIDLNNFDWEKVKNLCFQLLDNGTDAEKHIDDAVNLCFSVLSVVINHGTENQLQSAKEIFDYADKAIKLKLTDAVINQISQTLIDAVNTCDLKELEFDNIVECISQLIECTGQQCEVETLNYMYQTLICAIKRYSDNQNIDNLINSQTLDLIKKIFNKVVIRDSNDIVPLIEMGHAMNAIIVDQYIGNGGKKFELFEMMGLKYNDSKNFFDIADEDKLKEFLGNDIYRVSDQLTDGIVDKRIEIYEKIRLCVSYIDVGDLDQELAECFNELNSMICQYDNNNTALCLLDIEIVVDLIEKSLNKAITKNGIILGEGAIIQMFNTLVNAVANICKTDFIMELDDAGKVLDCLDKVFENGNKTLDTVVFEAMFASLHNVVLNISENITTELVEKIYAALKKLNQKLDSEQIIPSSNLVDSVSRICANLALKNFELNKDNADNIWNLMNKFLNTEGVTLDFYIASNMLYTLKHMLIDKQNPSKISLDDSLSIISQIFGKISTNKLGKEEDNLTIDTMLESFTTFMQVLFEKKNDQEKIKKTTGLIVKDGKILICNRSAVEKFLGQNMCSDVFNKFQQEYGEIDLICEQSDNMQKQLQNNKFDDQANDQSLKKIVDDLNDYITIRQNKLQENHIGVIMRFINTVLNETENLNSKVNFSSDMLSSIFRIWGGIIFSNKDCVTTKQDIDNIIKWANNILSLEEQKKIELNSKIINSIVATLFLVEDKCKSIEEDRVNGIIDLIDKVLEKHRAMEHSAKLVENASKILYGFIYGFKLDIKGQKQVIGIIEQFTKLEYEKNQENNGVFSCLATVRVFNLLTKVSSKKTIGDDPKAILDTISWILHNNMHDTDNQYFVDDEKKALLALFVRLWKVGTYRETIKQVTGFVADAPYKDDSERIENKETFKQFAGDKVYQIFFPEQQQDKQHENELENNNENENNNEFDDNNNYENENKNGSNNGNENKNEAVSIENKNENNENDEKKPQGYEENKIDNQKESLANDQKENRELDKDFMERKSVNHPNLSEENKTEKSEEKPQGDLEPLNLEPLVFMKLKLSELEMKLNESANIVQKPTELLNALNKILEDTLNSVTNKQAIEKRIIDKDTFDRITKILDRICGTLEKIDTENTGNIIENIYNCLVSQLVQKQSLDTDSFLGFLSISNKLGKHFELQDFMSSYEKQILLSQKSKEDLKKILKFIPESNMELQDISHISNFLGNLSKIVVPQGNKGNALVKPTELCGMLAECEVFGYCFKYYLMHCAIENLENDNNDNVMESWVSDISNAIKSACAVDDLDENQTKQIKKQILGELSKAAQAEDVIQFVKDNKDNDDDKERLEKLGRIQKLSEQELLKLGLEQEQKKEKEDGGEDKNNTGNDEVNKNNDKNKTENNVPIIDNINNLNQKENKNKENENEDNTGDNENDKNNDENGTENNNPNKQTQEIVNNVNTSNQDKNENKTKKNKIIKEEEGTNIKIEEKSGSNKHKDNNPKSSVGSVGNDDDDDIEKNKEKNKLVQTEQKKSNGYTPKPAGIYTTLAAISIFVPPVFGIGLFVLKFKNPEYKITGKDVILLFIYSLPIVAPIAGLIMAYKASQENREMETKRLANESSKGNDQQAIDTKINNISQNRLENIKTNIKTDEKNKTKTHNEKFW